ncbi:MAG: YitT family protein [Clostridia bacterium]|nr:YitT family protein [Clostridia bacterium]
MPLLFAGIINAFGVTVFPAPVSLYDSGISGTSMLLSSITPDAFSLSLFLVVLNVPLFLYGLKRQGIVFTVYSLFTVLIYSLSAFVITDILPNRPLCFCYHQRGGRRFQKRSAQKGAEAQITVPSRSKTADPLNAC